MYLSTRSFSRRRQVLLPTLLFVGTVIATPSFAEVSPEPAVPLAEMFEADRARMATEIVAIANRIANETQYFDDDMRPITLTGHFDVDNKVFQFDMEERFGPEAGYDELANMHRTIENAIEPLTSRIEDLYTIAWSYGGKDVDHWMPRPHGDAGTLSQPVGASKVEEATVPVVVAAGHGYYYHHKEKTWKPHRDPSNGVLEDTITPVLASELVRYLGSNKIPAEELRPQSGLKHEPSGLPWWHIGARYGLELRLPDNPEVWHSLPESTDGARERREDIKSRPLYANHVKSPAIIHIHTNADGVNPNVNGGRVYVATGRPEDLKLGRLALCGMSEAIHSVDRFQGFKVSTEPHPAADNAENSLAEMPSIIVETAFHTNASDAEFLKDPEFQKLSMMGVAKGYRLYTEGKSCETFAVAEIAGVEAFVGQQVNQSVTISGHPMFPVDMIYRPSRCRTEPCSAERKLVFDEAGIDAFRIPYFCAAEDVSKGPIDFAVWAKDAWGVQTNTASYRLTCKARGA